MNSLVFLFPNRLTKPDLEAINLKPPPFPRKKVAKLVDEDDDVEKHHHDKDQQQDLEGGLEGGHEYRIERTENYPPRKIPQVFPPPAALR